MNRLLTAAAARNHARLLDLHAQLCPKSGCLATIGGSAIYDDTMHLARAGQRWIGGWINGLLQAQVAGHRAGSTGVTGACGSPAQARPRLQIAGYVAHPDPSYPDTRGAPELTDRRHAAPTVFDKGWMGWQTATSDITLTLASSQSVCSVSSTWLQELDAAVYAPPSITVYVSDRPGQVGTKLATVRTPQVDARNQTVPETAVGTEPITGRYITLRVSALNGWSFVDEVSAAGPPAHSRSSPSGHSVHPSGRAVPSSPTPFTSR